MQKFYLDESGRCLGSYDGPDELCPFSGPIAMLPPENANTQIWNGSSWEFTIDAIRQRLIDRIGARYEAALAKGMLYQGKLVQIRDSDQTMIAKMHSEAVLAKSFGAPWSVDSSWRMLDNSFLALPSADDAIELGNAVREAGDRLRRTKWQHMDAVRCLRSTFELLSYDIETGW